MSTAILIGAQWGDEGKGKIVDLLAQDLKHVVRAQGGNNAGHTILVGDQEIKLHLVPSGILHPHVQCYLGAGMVIDPIVLIQELHKLQEAGVNLTGRLWISAAAHLILPYHILHDQLLEQAKGAHAVGTTGRGIGPCYADKVHRIGIRVGDLFEPEHLRKRLELALNVKKSELTALGAAAVPSLESIINACADAARELKPYMADVEFRLQQVVRQHEALLLEGAQGSLLDTTLGTYPFVTSSCTTAGGICASVGIGPLAINSIIGIAKAYSTRVGEGPFITEMSVQEIQGVDHARWREFGTTTGRKRRIGWLDLVALKTAVNVNAIDSLAVTKLDLLDEWAEIKLCVAYKKGNELLEHLPAYWNAEGWEPVYKTVKGWQTPTRAITDFDRLPLQARQYIREIEHYCGAAITLVSVGPERNQTIRVGGR